MLSLAGAITVMLSLSATAWAADSVLTPSPSSWDFGSSDVHFGGGANQNFTISNDTGPDLTVVSVGLTGADADQFQLSFDGCTNAFLSQGSSCGVSITFRPSSPAAKTATLELTDSDDGVLDIPLTGTGMTGTLTANPDPVVFNTQPYFSGGQTQNVNLQNSNDFSTQTSSASIVGPDAAVFSIAYGQNCEQQLFGTNNSCGIGIGFNPPAPGTFHAELDIASDSSSSPLRVPLQATALNGPTEDVSPRQTDFGSVAIGKSVSQAVTIANHGDYPLQIQQAFLVTGTPGTFPLTDDRCSGQVVDPGSSCGFTVSFQPSLAGFRDGAVIVITNTPQPVSPIGFTGTGVANPQGTAVVTGTPAAGSALGCRPDGYDLGTAFSYRWLRDGHELSGATGASFTPSDADVGARMACQLTAVNAVAGQTVTSPATAPVAATDLTRLPGSFVDRRGCRTVSVEHRLRVGPTAVAVRYSQPTLLWAPLSLSARRTLSVSVDGHTVGRGKLVAVSPRALSTLASGTHTLTIRSGNDTTSAPLLLGDCQVAVRVQGAPDRTTSIAVSASAALGATTITLPRGLTLHPGQRLLGQFNYTQSGYPTLGFPLVGRHSSANDITVTITGHRIRVTNLPARTGVIRLSLRPRVLGGTGGVVRVAAPVAGAPGTPSAAVLASWFQEGPGR